METVSNVSTTFQVDEQPELFPDDEELDRSSVWMTFQADEQPELFPDDEELDHPVDFSIKDNEEDFILPLDQHDQNLFPFNVLPNTFNEFVEYQAYDMLPAVSVDFDLQYSERMLIATRDYIETVRLDGNSHSGKLTISNILVHRLFTEEELHDHASRPNMTEDVLSAEIWTTFPNSAHMSRWRQDWARDFRSRFMAYRSKYY